MKLVIRYWSLVIGFWFGASMLSAQEPTPSQLVTLWDASGQSLTGTLQEITSRSVLLKTTAAESTDWRDVALLRFNDHSKPMEPRGAAIWLANGDRLIAGGTSIDNERLFAAWLRFPDWPTISLPLESVRGCSLELPASRVACDEITQWILNRKEARDELRLLNGDTFAGELESWHEGEFQLKAATGNLVVKSNDVLHIGFNPDLLARSESKELCWLVSLTDGSRVTVIASQSEFKADVLKATHVTGVVWDIPLAEVCELRVLRGRVTWLSDLKPLDFQHTPFLTGSRPWPLRLDQSVAGGPLRLNGREFPKGLGMHSRSIATFELNGRYRSFRAIVGLNGTTTGTGTAECSIEVDGRRVWSEPRLQRGRAIEVSLPNELIKAKRLTLLVDFGEQGDMQDHVNWCDAMLLPDQ